MKLSEARRHLGKSLYYGPSTLVNKLRLMAAGVKFGTGLETRGLIVLKVTGQITIGDNVRINSSPYANPIGGGERTYFQVLKNGRLEIGDNVGISNAAITCASSVKIGSHVFVGAGACIFDTDFHSLNPLQRVNRRHGAIEKVIAKPVWIDDYVFIGYKAIILKGAVVGRNSVIGAGAVVCGRIPENQVWAGNPARFVRELKEHERASA